MGSKLFFRESFCRLSPSRHSATLLREHKNLFPHQQSGNVPLPYLKSINLSENETRTFMNARRPHKRDRNLIQHCKHQKNAPVLLIREGTAIASVCSFACVLGEALRGDSSQNLSPWHETFARERIPESQRKIPPTDTSSVAKLPRSSSSLWVEEEGD